MPPAARPEFEPAFGSRAVAGGTPHRADTDAGAVPGVDEVPPAPGGTPVAEQPVPAEATSAPPAPGPPAPPASVAPPSPDAAPAPHLPDRPVPVPIEPDVQSEAESVDPTPVDGETLGARSNGVRWFRIRQRVVGACAIAILLVLGYYLVSLFQVWSTGGADDDGPVDAIVVMGAAQYDGRPSPQLAARLDHVVELWPQGVAPMVVVTGGNIPGDRFTEAEASATYLAERGVPIEALLLENAGSNSYESLEAVAALLEARGLDEVLIVTDPYHALRSQLIAREVGLNASVSSTDTSVVTGGESLRRHLQEAGGVAVGRIIGFDRLTRLVD